MRRPRWSLCVWVALWLFLCSPFSLAQEQPLPSPISPQADSARPNETLSASPSPTTPLYEDSNELWKMAEESEEMFSALKGFLTDMEISQADSDLSVSESLKLLKESTPILQDLKKSLKTCEREKRILKVSLYAAGAVDILLALCLAFRK